MSDLRKKAESCIEFVDKIGVLEAADGDTDSRRTCRAFEANAYEICKDYCGGHPADDDEPVTAEWLREIGFVKHSGCKSILHYILPSGGSLAFHSPDQKRGISIRWTLTDSVADAAYLPLLTTRRQVRKLIEALKGE